MTPERITEIAREAWTAPNPIERAIRQAVNETLEEAALKIDAKCADYAKDFAVPDAYECMEVVRALKLPEEP